MKLSFSTNAFVRYSVVEAVERIAAIGYEGVELLADVPHLYADSISTPDLDILKDVLKRTGLKVANINANTAVGYYGKDFWEPLFEPSLANPESELRRWRIDYSKNCIDLARTVDAPCISITSGRLVPGCSPERSRSFLKESLKELVDYAERRSVKIGIEYEPGLLIECFDELVQLLEEIDSRHLGANLDLGHSRVLGEEPETVISGLASKIFHLHIEDIRAGKHYHLIPGTGDMDFVRIFGILRRHGYKGFASVELYTFPDRPDTAAEQSLSYLQSVLETLEKEATDDDRHR